MKNKMRLASLDVKSFVTELRASQEQTLKGGLGDNTLLDCLTGIYPTLPPLACATDTNGHNCPCEIITHHLDCQFAINTSPVTR
jgi:hypothetical protein